MPYSITMYSTEWCGDCRNAKRFLKGYNIQFVEVNIDRDETAAQQVISWSGGRRVIPTFDIRTSEGKRTILHNPKLTELQCVLQISDEQSDEPN
jgi:mycoredoxin